MTMTSENTDNATQPQEAQDTHDMRDTHDDIMQSGSAARRRGRAEVRLLIPDGRDDRMADLMRDYAHIDLYALRDAMHIIQVHGIADSLGDDATDEEWADHYRLQAATMRIGAALTDAYADHLLHEATVTGCDARPDGLCRAHLARVAEDNRKAADARRWQRAAATPQTTASGPSRPMQ